MSAPNVNVSNGVSPYADATKNRENKFLSKEVYKNEKVVKQQAKKENRLNTKAEKELSRAEHLRQRGKAKRAARHEEKATRLTAQAQYHQQIINESSQEIQRAQVMSSLPPRGANTPVTIPVSGNTLLTTTTPPTATTSQLPMTMPYLGNNPNMGNPMMGNNPNMGNPMMGNNPNMGNPMMGNNPNMGNPMMGNNPTLSGPVIGMEKPFVTQTTTSIVTHPAQQSF